MGVEEMLLAICGVSRYDATEKSIRGSGVISSSSIVLSAAGVVLTAALFSFPFLLVLFIVADLSIGVNSPPPMFDGRLGRSTRGPFRRGVLKLERLPLRSRCSKSSSLSGAINDASGEMSEISGSRLRYVASPALLRGVSSTPPKA